MIRTDTEYEKIICLDHIGTYDTPSGTIKVLVVTIRIARSDFAPPLAKRSAEPTAPKTTTTEVTNRGRNINT